MRIPKLDLKEPILLDCGCANQKMKGYIGIDIDEHGQEILWDLRYGIPLPNESVKDLNVCHFLEHLTNKESKEFITEAQRVLIKGGTLSARQPHVDHPTAFYPDHESYWNEARVQSIQRNEPGWEIIANYNDGFQLIFQLRKTN
jgi:predicted SAM-dependent methyltransferase